MRSVQPKEKPKPASPLQQGAKASEATPEAELPATPQPERTFGTPSMAERAGPTMAGPAMAQPMMNAMGQPLVSAMAQPMMSAMGQPIGQPLAQPMVSAMGQPMSQPMGQPMVNPITKASPYHRISLDPIVKIAGSTVQVIKSNIISFRFNRQACLKNVSPQRLAGLLYLNS